MNWQGNALGNFAKALLNTLEIGTEPDDIIVKRIRTVVQAFQQYEEDLVRQMCQINVKCKVVARGTVDDETGQELAHWTIAFERGISAHIPLNNAAADRLVAKDYRFFASHPLKLTRT